MEVTDLAAIWGALAGSAALYIEARRWRAARTQIALTVNPGTASVPAEETDPYGNALAESREVVFIHITNKSPHPVKISTVFATDAADEQRGYVFPRPYPLELPIPFEIPARDSRILWVLREGLDAERLKFSAKTTGEETFGTKALVLDEQPRFQLHDPSGPG